MDVLMSARMPEENNRADCAILVVSCDEYSDLWLPFFNLFWRHWPDCPFRVCLGSNEAVFSYSRVENIRVGRDWGWSDGLRQMLQALDATYVLLFLEDFFLRRRVDTSWVLARLGDLRRLDGYMLRLHPNPGPDRAVPGFPEIGRIDVGAPYRVNAHAAFWRRQALLGILRDGESAWEFERKATKRSEEFEDGFFSVWNRVIHYGHHVVEKGLWLRWEARRFGRMGIGCDFSRRPVMTWRETWHWRFRKTFYFLWNLIPRRERQQLEVFSRRLRRKL
jgi:hypothetical protein